MKAAWEWVKKHWELLMGALLLALGFFLGVTVARKRPAPAPEANPTKEKAEEEAAEKLRRAELVAEDQKAEVAKEHAAVIAKELEETKAATEEVRSSPDRTNTYLHDVGKAVRGDEP